MKKVVYAEDDGFKNVALLRDTDPETMAPFGVQCGPPDIRELDWDSIIKEINNLLVDRGFYNLQSMNIGGLDSAIIAPIKRRIIEAYRNKENI